MWGLYIQTANDVLNMPVIVWYADWSVCDQTRQAMVLWLHQLGAAVEASFCHHVGATTLLNLR